jgi:hypothetical protein
MIYIKTKFRLESRFFCGTSTNTAYEPAKYLQSYNVFIDRWCGACGEKECDYPIAL